MKLLISKGAKINAANEDGSTPLCEAASNKHEDIVKYLVDSGADVNPKGCMYPPLTCVMGGDKQHLSYSIAKFLIANDSDVNVLEAVDASFDRGFRGQFTTRPLHIAARCGDTELIKLFVSNGADIEAHDSGGYTPLMNAVSWEHSPEAVEMLIEYGADVNASNLEPEPNVIEARFRALDLAKHDDIREILIQHGARRMYM